MSDADDRDVIVDVENAFANGDKTVINWKGKNYYKACDEPVVTNEDGSGTFCVKRQDHPGDIHEDFDGIRKTEQHGKMIVLVSFDMPGSSVEDHARIQSIMGSLKPHFEDESHVKVALAVRDRADQALMILEGNG